MNVQLEESLFLMQKIEKQAVPLRSSKQYIFIDIKFVGVITIEKHMRNLLRNAPYCTNSVHL